MYMLGLMVSISISVAGEMQLVSDEELDSIYAQGFANDAIVQTTGSLDPSLIGDNPIVINFPEQIGMDGQVLISDNAQQNAFNPVNAVNSAVGNVYNIFVIINSNWQDVNVNVNNTINAINSSNMLGAY